MVSELLQTIARKRRLLRIAKLDFLAADPAVYDFTSKLVILAEHIQLATKEKYPAQHPKPLGEGAVWTLSDNILSLQRANLALCQGGWAFACSPVLRSQIDCVMSLSVVVRSRYDQDLMGFKYTHGFIREQLRRPDLPRDERLSYQTQTASSIDLLKPVDREAARAFMLAGIGYWHAPEYPRPRDVIDDAALNLGTQFRGLYEDLSAGAHGGLVGLRAYRDAPDEHGPYPRKDPRGQNLALVTSAFLTLRGLDLRLQFEGLSADTTSAAHEAFQKLRTVAAG